MKTNTTLEQLIISKRCRKGKARAISSRGAYWLAHPAITIRRWGGNGIGQNTADCTRTIELRHYRDGKVRVIAKEESYHQNYGTRNKIEDVPSDASTAEEFVVFLKQCNYLSDYWEDELIADLVAFGLPEYDAPSPDDESPTSPE